MGLRPDDELPPERDDDLGRRPRAVGGPALDKPGPGTEARLAGVPGAAFDVVVIAASAGGLNALSTVLSGLPKDFPVAIAVVQHLDPRHRSTMADLLDRRCALRTTQAVDGDHLEPGRVYIAPPDRHLLVSGRIPVA